MGTAMEVGDAETQALKRGAQPRADTVGTTVKETPPVRHFERPKEGTEWPVRPWSHHSGGGD